MIKINIDTFVSLKKKHGPLVAFIRDEGGDWTEWKREFGYPKEFSALRFKDGEVWNGVTGEAQKAC